MLLKTSISNKLGTLFIKASDCFLAQFPQKYEKAQQFSNIDNNKKFSLSTKSAF